MESQSLLREIESFPLEYHNTQRRPLDETIPGLKHRVVRRTCKFYRSSNNTAFLDGLRGLFAIAVVNQHIFGSFEKSTYYGFGLSAHESAQCSYRHEEIPFSHGFFQLPIIRLTHAGDAGVCVFFVLSGFVLSFRALGEAHRQNWQKMLSTLSSSTFRRGLRLFLPLLASTAFTMITLQLGLWESSHSIVYNRAIMTGVPERQPDRMSSFGAQLKHWLLSWSHLTNIWSWEEYISPYDVHLWTIPSEFRASMLLYLVLLSTGRLLPVVRDLLLASFVIYAYCWGRWDVCLFLSGALLADTVHTRNTESIPERQSEAIKKPWKERSKLALQLALITCSLFLLSSPTFCFDYTPGYRLLAQLIPSFDRQPYRFFPGLGAIFLVGVLVHTKIELPFRLRLLTTPFVQYLGRISYSIYILHGPLLHLVGYPLFPALWEITGKDEMWRYVLGFIAGWMMFFLLLVWVSDFFCRWIDEESVRFSKWVESKLLA
ncbi:hypothetical protein P170DRAFT_492900 [Aspergillus steynii IBT 23096]|uniref:Acyltransferase 3 domain-containing protein n=1 Tax=Aspergillus steynii IBT 23096 TaxID=1392250 RepID=A0A2I2GD32_9EURO|nr:uncharacterized protein P170DRAFT_492900 [Aspergillus steynii IBT 23096]PLB50804.1 hypothetical protein P170DRAFT_492900 [Aspergillus steynii IBT 23096]